MAKCRVCGAAHAACGPTVTVIPIDSNISISEGTAMTLKEYEVTTEGRRPHQTTMLLNEHDARRLGLLDDAAVSDHSQRKSVAKPKNKAKSPKNKRVASSKPQHNSVEDATDPDASEV